MSDDALWTVCVAAVIVLAGACVVIGATAFIRRGNHQLTTLLIITDQQDQMTRPGFTDYLFPDDTFIDETTPIYDELINDEVAEAVAEMEVELPFLLEGKWLQ